MAKKTLNKLTNAEKRIVWAAEYWRTRTGKASLDNKAQAILKSALSSKYRSFTISELSKKFGVTPEEVIKGPPKYKTAVNLSPQERSIQKSGFQEGAKIPVSNIRKIDR